MKKFETREIKNPIRILHVNAAMVLGGTDIMIMNLYRKIDRSNYQFDFLYFTNEVCHFDEEIRSLGGRIYRIPPPTHFNYLEFIKNIRRIINRAENISVVHVHTMLNSGLVAYAAKKEGVPTRIVHSHSTKGGKKENLLYLIYEITMKMLIKRNATKLIACGRDAGEYLFGKKQFSLVGLILPNTINIEEYRQAKIKRMQEIRDALAIGDQTILIGQIGSLKNMKNHGFSIEIAKVLKANRLDFCMLFVGDGENRDILERKINLYGLSNQVKLLGLRNDIPLLLNMFDILIMPSLFEGVPVTLIEAQAAKTLSVVSNVISKEVDLQLGLIKYLDLKKPVGDWANVIIKEVRNEKRVVDDVDVTKAFSDNGYLVEQSVRKLVNIYSN